MTGLFSDPCMLCTGLATNHSTVNRRSKEGRKKPQDACNIISMYQKMMGGVDTNDFMRQAKYSLQKTYHCRKWYKSMFLVFLDLVLTNVFILWKFINPKTARDDFYYQLVEEMLSYSSDVDESIAQRNNKKRKRTINAKITIPKITTDHKMTELRAPPKKTIRARKEYDSDGMELMVGNGGKNKQFLRCFICSKINKNFKIWTRYYCSWCGVPVCHLSKLQPSKNHEQQDTFVSCWDMLHSEKGQGFLLKSLKVNVYYNKLN